MHSKYAPSLVLFHADDSIDPYLHAIANCYRPDARIHFVTIYVESSQLNVKWRTAKPRTGHIMLLGSILQLQNDVTLVSGNPASDQLFHRKTQIFEEVGRRPVERLADWIRIGKTLFQA